MENNHTLEEQELPKELVEETAEEPSEQIVQSLYGKIIGMSVSQKIKLATLGNREARNLLIKDSNRLVIQAVINSPKMTEDDAYNYAQNRSLSEEVVKLISLKKQWMKDYRIKLALITNPKTPTTVSMKLLNYMQEKDIRNLAKSKNVPGIISRAAIGLLSKKGKL